MATCFSAGSQNIAFFPIVSKNSNVPITATNSLTSKLTQIATSNGAYSSEVPSTFIITAHVEPVSEEVTATAPAMHTATLNISLYIGEACTGTLFNSIILNPIKGVGTSKDRAYVQALQSIRADAPEIQAFIAESKKKIIEKYNSDFDFIVDEARSLANREKYDEAITLLNSVPKVCKEARKTAMQICDSVFQQKIDMDGTKFLNRATNEWNIHPTLEGAETAVALLSQIHPLSSSITDAKKLSETISTTLKQNGVKELSYEVDIATTPEEKEIMKEHTIDMISDSSASKVVQDAVNEIKWQ